MLRSFLILGLLGVMFMSCGDDEPTTTLPRTSLNYDNNNVNAPNLAAGDYISATKFPSSSLTTHVGRMVSEIEFYTLAVPESCIVQIFGEGTPDAPGEMLFSQNVTVSTNADSWNLIDVDPPIEVGDTDLWFAVKYSHTEDNRTIGCDIGPANSNGDFFNDSNGEWTTLRTFSNSSVDINWNIRAYLAAE